jgi:hypothetical protein
VLANWPQIVSTIQMLWDNIVQGWNIVRPLLGDFMIGWQAMAPIFDYIKAHADQLKPAIIEVGVVVGLLAFAFLGMVAAGALVVAAFIGLMQTIDTVVQVIKRSTTEGGAQFDALGKAARQMGSDIGGVFSGIGGGMHQLVINIQLETSAAGRQFDALGRAARQMQTDIGNDFSAIGGAANQMAGVVGSAFSRIGGSVHQGLVDVAGVFDNFGRAVNGALGLFNVSIKPIGRFAQGGVVPGYAPGQDTVPALLSPGEGVLTPQAVRGLGGAGAVEALNRTGSGIHGLGAQVISDFGSLAGLVGAMAGQCVVAVEKWTGHFFPVAMASQMTRWINSATAAIGSIFVSTIPPFGHTGIVLPGGKVLDSNWGLDERVRIHNLSDIPSIAGYITGIGGISGGLSGLAGLGISLGELLKPLVSPLQAAAHAAAGLIPEAWARPLASALVDKVAANVVGRQSGGPVLPGNLYTVGERGPELFSPSMPGQIVPVGAGRGVESLLREQNRLLAVIADRVGGGLDDRLDRYRGSMWR